MELSELTIRELYKLYSQVSLEILMRLWWVIPIMVIVAVILIKGIKGRVE